MIKITDTFKRAYEALNAEQKRAVDTIEGPVMVLAGPGTGKTQILAMRIANILIKTDTQPNAILALTFTDSGAQAMKKRLVTLIGETAYYVHIQTFHGFSTQMIQSNPEYFPELSEGQPLSDLDRITFLQKILLEHSFQLLKPINAPLLYLKSILTCIQQLKREGFLPAQFQKIVSQEVEIFESEKSELKKTLFMKRQKNLQKNQELLKVFELYQLALSTYKRYDFEDMISFTLRTFQEQPLLLQEYQERLLYFLVDEYQDTNSSQNHILTSLASFWGDEANVFAVGDPNQSIYRFQGASLENTFAFLDTYPQTLVITLKENYRSPQVVLDSAHVVISHNQIQELKLPLALDQKLHSQKGQGELIELYRASSSLLESLSIAQKAKSLIDAGEHPAEIAIIVRNNVDTAQFADTLARWQIPYEIEGGANILSHPLIMQLLTVFQTISQLQSNQEDLNVFVVLNYEWLALEKVMILKVTRFAAENRTHIIDVLLKSTLLEALKSNLIESELVHLSKIEMIVQKFISWGQLDTTMHFVRWFEKVMHESGFFEYVMSRPTSIEDLNRLHTLFSAVQAMTRDSDTFSLKEFLHIIEVMQEYNLSLPEIDLDMKKSAVRIITAHKSKGQEWNHVFIAGLVDKKWGNNTVKELIKLPEGLLQYSKPVDDQKNDDERRLFYVALTRAKKQLYLSIPDSIQTTASARETSPSLFIHELPTELLKENDTFEHTHTQKELLVKLLQESEPNDTVSGESEQHFLHSLVEKYKLSATALNTYLECAYKFKLNHLLNIPRTRPPAMAYGTAIHASLEFTFKEMKEAGGQLPLLEKILEEFQTSLSKELLDPQEFQGRLKKGKDVLGQYLKYYEGQLSVPLAVERAFGYGWSKAFLDDIPLSGKVDKVEVIDPLKKTVKIVDYKTGKPKSRNDIEGKTKASTGDYKRQLVFYTLLTRLDRSFTMIAQEAEIDFVQPTDVGTFKKESFTITDEEIEELKELIREVMKHIRALEFPRTTDYHICHDCEFAKHCWPEGIPSQKK